MSEAVTVPSLMMMDSIVSEESLARDTHTHARARAHTHTQGLAGSSTLKCAKSLTTDGLSQRKSTQKRPFASFTGPKGVNHQGRFERR